MKPLLKQERVVCFAVDREEFKVLSVRLKRIAKRVGGPIAGQENSVAVPVLPHTELGVATYYVLAPAEASANLARFDGVRYGHRSGRAGDLMEHYTQSRAEGFGPEVKRRILLGTYVLSSGYYDAYYIRAQKARTLIRNDFTEAFKHIDVILSPTSPTPAHKLGEMKDNPLAAYLEDVFTIPVNLAGLPGISVPCGNIEVDGIALPIGLQIIGKALDESTVLRVAHAFEQSR